MSIASGASNVRTVAPCGRSTHPRRWTSVSTRSEEHTSELQSPCNLVCRLLLEKKKKSLTRESCLEERSLHCCHSLASLSRCPNVPVPPVFCRHPGRPPRPSPDAAFTLHRRGL